MFKLGDIVFFKTAKRGTKRSIPEGKFNGHGFGVLLGFVPPFAKDPLQSQVRPMMGNVGYITFDDVAEFFGDEIGKQCVEKFLEKYAPKPDPAAHPPEPPKILGPDGKPLQLESK